MHRGKMSVLDFENGVSKHGLQRRLWLLDLKDMPGFIPALGHKIYWDRREQGLSLAQCLVKYGIEPDEHKSYLKSSKKYRKFIKMAHKAAKQWWLSQIGTMALQKTGNIDLLKIHFRNEFGVDLDHNASDVDFGFDIVVRPKE